MNRDLILPRGNKQGMDLKLTKIENHTTNNTYNTDNSITNASNSIIILFFKMLILPFKLLFNLLKSIYVWVNPKIKSYNYEKQKILNRRKSLKQMKSMDKMLNNEIF